MQSLQNTRSSFSGPIESHVEYVVLVDENDRELGSLEKLEAHQSGLLHRAISVLIRDTQGRMLLQKRAYGKYHSPGLWTNACCSHPRPGEAAVDAAVRRSKEELGLEIETRFLGSFIYRAEFENGLIEHEFDHIFTSINEDMPWPDPEEVAELRWVDEAELHTWMSSNPEQFTVWFRLLVDRFRNTLFS